MAEIANKAAAPSWEAAMRTELFARSVKDRYQEEITDQVVKAHGDGSATIQQVLEADKAGAYYTTAHADAVDALILSPAPDFASVALKIQLGISAGAFDRDVSDNFLRVIADDIRRLIGEFK